MIPGALAMYLFNDFNDVIAYELSKSINKKKNKYEMLGYIKSSNIEK